MSKGRMREVVGLLQSLGWSVFLGVPRLVLSSLKGVPLEKRIGRSLE